MRDVPRPAAVCRRLLAALEASEGRRRRRKRNTTPDAIGLAVKRRLLEAAAEADPEPRAFEGWLLERALAGEGGAGSGAARAMAMEILAEWRTVSSAPEFARWLERGAPSDDAAGTGHDAPGTKRDATGFHCPRSQDGG